MSDRIVLMRQGRIEQVGTPRDLYDRPRLALRGRLHRRDQPADRHRGRERRVGGHALRVGDDVLRGGVTRPWRPAARPGSPSGPRRSRSSDERAAPSGRERVPATVSEAVYAGSAVRVHVALAGGQRSSPTSRRGPRARSARRCASPGRWSRGAVSATDRRRCSTGSGPPRLGPRRRGAAGGVRHRAALHPVRAAAGALVLAAQGRCHHPRADAGELPAALRHLALPRHDPVLRRHRPPGDDLLAAAGLSAGLSPRLQGEAAQATHVHGGDHPALGELPGARLRVEDHPGTGGDPERPAAVRGHDRRSRSPSCSTAAGR